MPILRFRTWAVEDETDEQIWIKLIKLLYETKADYTLFFRQLSLVIHLPLEEVTVALDVIINKEVFQIPLTSDMKLKWVAWLEIYLQRLGRDHLSSEEVPAKGHDKGREGVSAGVRKEVVKRESEGSREAVYKGVRESMNRANPKYVFRNWMAILAYEK